MLGILLALQVNNWNNQRQVRKVEMEMLLNLRDAMSTDLEKTIALNIATSEQRIQLTKALLSAIETGQIIPDSIAKNYILIGRTREFLPVTIPYKILESKGLDIIKNESLKIEIVNLYSQEYSRLENSFQNEAFNIRDIYRPMMRKYFKIFPPSAEIRALPVDFGSMIQDLDFQNIIAVLNSNNIRIKNLLIELKTKVEAVIQKIELEINRS